jgi:thiol reductant ABC exporter CydD subunit
MSTLAAERRRGSLIDRRLAARVTATRRYLVTAVAVGLGATVCVIAQAVLLGTVVAAAVLHHASLRTLAPQLVGLAAAFAARGLCVWAGEAAAQRTSAAVTSTLRRQLLRQALALGPAWLAGERAGELALTATRGTAALDTYFGRYLPQAVLAGLAPLGILAWVGWEDWPSFLILAAMVAAVPVAMVRFGRESAERTRRQWRRLSSLSARFLELLRGLPTLRAFGREEQGRREVAGTTEGLRQATMSTLRVAFLSALALEFVAGIGTGLVAMVLGLRLLGGTVSLYTALGVLLVSPEVFLPLRRAGAEFHASEEGQAAADRILALLDLDQPGEALPEPGTATPATAAPASEPDAAEGRRAPGRRAPGRRAPGLDLHGQVLRTESVSVTFPGRAAPALEGLDLVVEQGAHVALVGPSGSGKSTTIALLLGFVRPDAGRVIVAGADLSTIDPAPWRTLVSWVPQRPQLVHGTLADNLRLGAPDASDRRLEAIAEAAGLAPLLRGLPKRLDTAVGDGGLTLSAGERQRVAIARAVLRNAPVVLLDEPVAHLDRFSELGLRQALDGWLDDRTVLVAAHRPELVSRIDRVVALPGRERLVPDTGADAARGGDDALGTVWRTGGSGT